MNKETKFAEVAYIKSFKLNNFIKVKNLEGILFKKSPSKLKGY